MTSRKPQNLKIRCNPGYWSSWIGWGKLAFYVHISSHSGLDDLADPLYWHPSSLLLFLGFFLPWKPLKKAEEPPVRGAKPKKGEANKLGSKRGQAQKRRSKQVRKTTKLVRWVLSWKSKSSVRLLKHKQLLL